ncbi:hypothetical protein BDI4_100056 [Burkholderia diffusa]|nr:hypothetical protein BDI4_100056 [Burkholderia diffusa]
MRFFEYAIGKFGTRTTANCPLFVATCDADPEYVTLPVARHATCAAGGDVVVTGGGATGVVVTGVPAVVLFDVLPPELTVPALSPPPHADNNIAVLIRLANHTRFPCMIHLVFSSQNKKAQQPKPPCKKCLGPGGGQTPTHS